MSLQDLRLKRAEMAKAAQELVNKPIWDDATDKEPYDRIMADIDAVDARIERINAFNQKVADDALTEGVATGAEQRGRDTRNEGLSLYAKWLRGGDRALKAEDWAKIRNTMSTGVGSEGGFTVATEVARSVVDALKEYGGVRRVATVIQTSMGNPMNFPTSDGTSEIGEIVAENAAAAEQDVTFGVSSLPVYKYGSKVVKVPYELLQDSNVDIESFVRSRLVTRIGRITNTHFTTGTGTSQPRGVQTASPVGVTAANGSSQVTAVTYDSLVNLQHSVDPAYREGGSAGWMFADATLREIRKVKDGQSRPIFVPGYETGAPGGAPDRLLGYPITINQDMPAMAAGSKSILFGNFAYYTIRDVMGVELFRFDDSPYVSRGQVGFLAWMLAGGNLIDSGGAIKAFVNAAS